MIHTMDKLLEDHINSIKNGSNEALLRNCEALIHEKVICSMTSMDIIYLCMHVCMYVMYASMYVCTYVCRFAFVLFYSFIVLCMHV